MTRGAFVCRFVPACLFETMLADADHLSLSIYAQNVLVLEPEHRSATRTLKRVPFSCATASLSCKAFQHNGCMCKPTS
eukprot:6188333-Pleurochrysis_carterae.AAC.7